MHDGRVILVGTIVGFVLGGANPCRAEFVLKYLHQGQTLASLAGTSAHQSESIGDLNGGAPEIVFLGSGGIGILNGPTGSQAYFLDLGGAIVQQVLLTDIDGDSYPDVVASTTNSAALVVIGWQGAGTATGDFIPPNGESRLLPNSPNPFSQTTAIRFVLDHAADVELSVFDASGRRVRRMSTGSLLAGPHDVAWDGRDDHGAALPSGEYFYSVRQDAKETLTGKAIRLE